MISHISDWGFLNYGYLKYLSITLVVIFFLLIARQIKEKRIALLLMENPKLPVLPVILSSLIVFSLILALTRPYTGIKEIEVPTTGRDIMVLFDVSKSMLTKDVPPDRLTFAKRKLLDLIDLLRNDSFNGASSDRLGLVLFAGESYLFCPPTSDYSVLKMFTNTITTDFISVGGSDIDQALETAISSVESAKAIDPIFIILSDGEDLDFQVGKSISKLREHEIPLYALGFGTTEGKPIELHSGVLIKDSSGNIVISKLNEEPLRELSQGSGAIYQRASIGDSDLQRLLASITPKESSNKLTSQVKIYNEIGPFALLALLGLLIVLLAIGKREFIFFIITLVCISLSKIAVAEPPPLSPTISLRDSYLAYQNGDYQTALNGFSHHHNLSPNDNKILQSLASSQYKLKDYKSAAKNFSLLNSRAKNGREKFKALYNLGNSMLMSQDYKSAIDDYTEALKVKPEDSRALHNLDIAKKLQEEKEKQQQKDQSESSSSADSEQSQQSKQSSESHDSQNQSDQQSSQSQSQSSSATNENHESSGQGESTESSKSSSDSQSEPQGNEDGESSMTNSSESSSFSEDSSSANGNGETAESSSSQLNSESKTSSHSVEPSRSQEFQSHNASAPQHDSKALKEQEAKSWLDSIEDSPVLLFKKDVRRGNNAGQKW